MSQTRLSPETIRSRVTEQLLAYLGAGHIEATKLPQTLNPQDFDFTDPERVKQIHFVLSSRVQRFLEALPSRLRQLKMTTTTRRRKTRGAIHGQVDWEETITRQAQQGFTDPTVFTIRTKVTQVQTPENQLVKKLLGIILAGVERLEELDPAWQPEQERSAAWLRKTLEEHVHLRALPAPEEISLTERELETVRRSRHELYTEAYRLYRCYQDFLADRLTNDDVREIYRETLIAPAETSTLFELYCLFEVIDAQTIGEPMLAEIEPGMSEFARLKTPDGHVEIYNNQGEPLNLSYPMPSDDELSETVPRVIRQQLAAKRATWDAQRELLDGNPHERYYQGQPDLLWLRFTDAGSEQELAEVRIGEAKYTRGTQRFKDGLEQLQEYLHLARWDGEFLIESEIPVSGYLFTDSVQTESDTAGLLTHIRMNDVDTPELEELFGGL